MLELIKAGGWVMWPILLCSVIALAIIVERFWSLQRKRTAPRNLVNQIWQWARDGELDAERVKELRRNSPLGRILAAGLVNRRHEREVMKEAIEEVGRHVAHELERFRAGHHCLRPWLLGTVLGMIKVFTVITTEGVGDASVLASGIAEALVTTAAGLIVAIPTLLFYRYFRGRVDELVITMEQDALKLVEALCGQRERDMGN